MCKYNKRIFTKDINSSPEFSISKGNSGNDHFGFLTINTETQTFRFSGTLRREGYEETLSSDVDKTSCQGADAITLIKGKYRGLQLIDSAEGWITPHCTCYDNDQEQVNCTCKKYFRSVNVFQVMKKEIFLIQWEGTDYDHYGNPPSSWTGDGKICYYKPSANLLLKKEFITMEKKLRDRNLAVEGVTIHKNVQRGTFCSEITLDLYKGV